jgi:glycosyltransferase involved in cell wall biosynthesis
MDGQRQRAVALLLGPSREALSGVSTHVNALMASPLADGFALEHFQVGSEGRTEGLASKLLRFLASPLLLLLTILRLDAAVVHINTSLNAKAFWRDLVYLMASRLAGARVVYQVHGGSLRRFGRNPFIAAVMRVALRLADRIVVLSRAEVDAFLDLVPASSLERVPNGVACEAYRKYNRAPDASGALRLIYIGRLAPAKGLDETIRGLAAALKAGARATLTIAGGGPEELRLRALVKQAGIERAVTFAGPAHGDAKARLLSQSDVLMLPSYSEGLPYALLEAMAAGAVPVVTPVGGIPDVVAHGETGFFVPVGDATSIASAIEQLAGDRRSLARMSAACRKRVAAAFSIERVARDFTSLYSILAATRSPRPVL